MNSPALNAINLSKSFKKDSFHIELFSNLNFSLQSGEVLGLVGNNGTGKSTLLKIIAGILKPSEGRIELYGKLNSIIDLGQNFSPDLTGIENLKMNLRNQNYNTTAADQKIKEIAAIAEIGDYLYQPIKNYSSGMLLRLGFSLYTSIPCDILILDEIISVGDLLFRNKCEEIIRNLIKSGVTVIIATHDLETINALCNKCLLMHKGKTLFGATDNVLSFYKAHALENTLTKDTLEMEQQSYGHHGELAKKVDLIGTKILSNKKKLSYADPIRVEIYYKVLEPMSVGITLNLFYQKKIPLLSSCMSYEENSRQKAMHEKGSYILTVTIPATTLAPAEYSIDLSFHDAGELAFKNYKLAVVFTVTKDKMLQSLFKKALPPFPLLPKLNWISEKDTVPILSILKDEAYLETLYKTGFVRMPVVDESVVKKIRAFYFQLFPDSEQTKDNYISIIDPMPDIRAKCHYEIINALSDYLEKYFKDYKVVIATFFVKPQSDHSYVDFHHDPTLTDPEYYDDFTLWIPLEDVAENDGEMIIIPHSHKLCNKINFYTYVPSYLNEMDEKEGVHIYSKSGEALMFFNRTAHASKTNVNKKIRIAVSLKMCHKDAKIYSYFKTDQINKAERFAQRDDYYLYEEWNEKKRPENVPSDGIVEII